MILRRVSSLLTHGPVKAVTVTLAALTQIGLPLSSMAADHQVISSNAAPQPLTVPSPAVLTFLETQDRLEVIALRIAFSADGQCANRWRHPGLRTHKLKDYPRSMRRDLREFAASDPRVFAIQDPKLEGQVLRGDRIVDPKGRALDANSQALQMQLALGRLNILRGGQTMTVKGQWPQLCYRPIRLTTSHTVEARTTPNSIEVSLGLVNYARSDDELAYAIAHELSHFMLDHSRVLSNARQDGTLTPSLRRLLETDADRGAIFLMQRAQYDVTAALSFIERSSFLRDFPLLGMSSHPSRSQRMSDVSAAISAINSDPHLPETVGVFVQRFRSDKLNDQRP